MINLIRVTGERDTTRHGEYEVPEQWLRNAFAEGSKPVFRMWEPGDIWAPMGFESTWVDVTNVWGLRDREVGATWSFEDYTFEFLGIYEPVSTQLRNGDRTMTIRLVAA